MNTLLFLPPVAFVLILAVTAGLVLLASRLAFRPAGRASGKAKAYACGEDFAVNRAPPEYGQFFPFAFFFTIMHVVALIVATAPVGSVKITILAVLYVLVSAVGLSVLFRD